jgi:hypothetical protein
VPTAMKPYVGQVINAGSTASLSLPPIQKWFVARPHQPWFLSLSPFANGASRFLDKNPCDARPATGSRSGPA